MSYYTCFTTLINELFFTFRNYLHLICKRTIELVYGFKK